MAQYLSIMLTVMIVSNYVLAQFLGICPFLGVSKKLDSAVGMSIAVTFVMVLATVATWPIQHLLLNPMGIGYLQTVVFILVIVFFKNGLAGAFSRGQARALRPAAARSADRG